MKPGVIIVTYDSAQFLEPCLESALAHTPHVVVVDNASADSCVEIAQRMRRRFPSLKVIANHANRGFAAAVNQGVRELDADLLVLLNPDARVVTGLAAMADTCRQPGVGAVGGRLRTTDGDHDQRGFCVRRFPTAASLILETFGINRLWPGNPVNRRFRAHDIDLNLRQTVDQPAGAFLMFRRDCWERLGGFDERFHPLWFEDVDFLARLRHSGYEIWYEPRAVAIHYGGHSIAGLQPSQRQQYWYGNLLRYAGRHLQSNWAVRAVAASVLVGYAARRLASLPANGGYSGRHLSAVLDGGSVWRLAGQCLLAGRLPEAVPNWELGDTGAASAEDEKTRKAKLTKSHSHGL